MYELPTCVEVGGVEVPIESDYRAALDICVALSDPELSEAEKAEVMISIFYPEWENIEPRDYQEAINRCVWFINGGSDSQPTRKSPKLMDWEQDFQHIVAPINRVMGQEIRGMKYLHWWTFLSAYYEIGDCLFAQIVRIRNKRAMGKQLTKEEKEWYRQNRNLVDLKTVYTQAEQNLLENFLKKAGD